MEIILDENAGFCFGVKNAVDTAFKESDNNPGIKIYTYGPLIHNKQVVNKLKKQGIDPVYDIEDIKEEGAWIIIRSHGISEEKFRQLEDMGLRYIDCTCPFVSSIQRKVKDYYQQGYKIFIVGDKTHPEVIGINGWCNYSAHILEDEKTVDKLPIYDKICLVAQTTVTKKMWNSVVDAIQKKYTNSLIINTICSATEKRQESAQSLSKIVDCMIVIGSNESSNTNKLFQICKENCKNAYHIENAQELPKEALKEFKRIGITAGASTPDWIIKEVIVNMQEINDSKLESQDDISNTPENDADIKKDIPEISGSNTDNEKNTADTPENDDDVSEELADTPEGDADLTEETSDTTESDADIREETADTSDNDAIVSEEIASAPENDADISEETADTPENDADISEETADTPENDADSKENMMKEYEKSMRRVYSGDTVKGTIIMVTEDEVMVNIGYKSDGIIKKEDYTWESDVCLKDLVKTGDEVEVVVVSINDGEGNVVLSKKLFDAEQNWNKIESIYNEKLPVEGLVKEIVKGGGIVEVLGIRTFMPASQFDIRYSEDLNIYLNTKVTVNVIEYNREKRRIIISRRVFLKKEREIQEKAVWESIEEGQKITGEVKRLTNFGAFVDIGGVDGLIHISELSWSRVRHPSDVVKPGDKVEVAVLNVDKVKKKISLGLKQTLPEPWSTVGTKYNIGDIVEVKVLRFSNFGAFVELEPGVDGLIHISQISDKRISKPSDVLNIGDIVSAKIIDIKLEEKKASLSIKELTETTEE